MSVVPLFSVNGEPNRELGRDLAALKIESIRYGQPSLQAEFASAQALEVGTTLRVSIDTDSRQLVVFDGQISAIEFVFEEAAPPSVLVSAADASPSHRPSGSGSVVLARGNELVSAHVRVQKARAFVSVAGSTTGSPDIMVGSVLRLERIGASFSGDGYEVTRITHEFDLEHGLTSTFEAQRPV